MPEAALTALFVATVIPFAVCAASQRASDRVAAFFRITQRPEAEHPRSRLWGRFSTVREWSYWIVVAAAALLALASVKL